MDGRGRALRRLLFGTHIDHLDPVASARTLEAEGFDYIHSGEHMLFHTGTGPSAVVALAAAAAATERIRLLDLLLLVPLYPTILLAKMVATLDLISKGRYELGVGVGGDFPKEFTAMGVPLAGRGSRLDETLEVLRRGWSEEILTFHGRYHRLDDVRFEPRPRGRVPVWVGGRSEAAMRRAGRAGDVWIPYLCTPDMLARGLAVVRQAAERAGRDPAAVRGAVLTYYCVYDDRARARDIATRYMSGVYKRDFSRRVDDYVVHGTPEDARARLREFHDAGATAVMSVLAAPPEDAAEMRMVLTREVFPEFRERR